MLSAYATIHSQCIFDAQFSYRTKYPDDTYVVWRLNNANIKGSDNMFKMSQSNNTYTLYVRSVHKYMGGHVSCELYERLGPNRSRLLQKQKGKLTVLYPEWFDRMPEDQVIYQYDGAVALVPYVLGDEQGAVTKIHIKDNNLLMYFVSEPFVDDNMHTFLALFVYKCENGIIYIKIVYDPTIFNHHTLKAKITSRLSLHPLKVQRHLKVKWVIPQCSTGQFFTYEVSNHAGVFPNISPVPTDQVSKRAELTLLDPPKHTLIAVRIRTAHTLPGQPEPGDKHVVLRSAPEQAPSTEPTPGPSHQY